MLSSQLSTFHYLMKQLWRIPDFLDLEYFFVQDQKLAEEEGESALRDRDRALYLEEIDEEVAGAEPDREWLIYRWLQARRRMENQAQGGQALLPGRMWYELYGLFWSLFSFLAVAAGAGLAYSFLSYSGRQPVNVSSFFLFFVGLQTLFLVALLTAGMYRKIRGLDLRSSLLLTLVNSGLNSLLFKIRKYGLDSMEAGRREQFTAALGAVRARGKGYGAIFFWPLFLLFQLFGIAFNFGVLGSILVKVASADLAFGWQSTIQLSSEFVSTLVQWLALPWSWLLSASTSYPSLAQIEGSRMILKEGIYHLASEDLASWWPFLCLAIFCYCLLPRLLLFVAGTVGRKRSLARISFRRVDHNQLVHRLLTPRLETRTYDEPQSPASADVISVAPEDGLAEKAPVAVDEEEPSAAAVTAAVNGTLLALVPDELFDDCNLQELERYCQQAFGYAVGEMIRINEEHSDSRALLLRLGEGPASCRPLLILQEAWQPPIREMLRLLQELRETCDQETHIIVALVGRPRPETLFTPVSDSDLHIWRQKTAPLGDPCLQVSPLLEKQ
ncbi:MAG: DUF2868 domain-containing protein [Proteobacteria bacterium]|nr:DUF2868 domain-containing protein [Pseudomonadota bacterium]